MECSSEEEAGDDNAYLPAEESTRELSFLPTVECSSDEEGGDAYSLAEESSDAKAKSEGASRKDPELGLAGSRDSDDFSMANSRTPDDGISKYGSDDDSDSHLSGTNSCSYG